MTGAAAGVVDSIANQIMAKNSDFSAKYFTSPAFFLSLLAIAVTIALWITISKGKKKLVEATSAKYSSDYQRILLIRIANIVLKVVLLIAAVTTILRFHGIAVNAFIISFLFIIVVVVLAGQDAIKDCIAGLLIFMNQYYSPGDVVKVDDLEGKVLKMTLFSTRLQDIITEDILTVSNRQISQARVLSHFTAINLGLSYELPASEAHRIMNSISAEVKKIEGIEDCVYRGTQDFGDSAIQYQLAIYTLPEKRYALRRATLMKIQECLAKEGISIPYQQVDIHVKKEEI